MLYNEEQIRLLRNIKENGECHDCSYACPFFETNHNGKISKNLCCASYEELKEIFPNINKRNTQEQRKMKIAEYLLNEYVDNKSVKSLEVYGDKPLQNCTIGVYNDNSLFKFIEIDENIRNKNDLGNFNGYKLYSCLSPGYKDKNIYIFGKYKKDDYKYIIFNKKVIKALKEAGCKINILYKDWYSFTSDYKLSEGDMFQYKNIKDNKICVCKFPKIGDITSHEFPQQFVTEGDLNKLECIGFHNGGYVVKFNSDSTDFMFLRKAINLVNECSININTNKPLKNCIIETNKEYSYFKFVKVDEVIRNKDNIYNKYIGTFNGYIIRSYDYPNYYGYKIIWVFGWNKDDDNIKVKCNKEVILALEEAGCKVIIKDKDIIYDNCKELLQKNKNDKILTEEKSEENINTFNDNQKINERKNNMDKSLTTKVKDNVKEMYLKVKPFERYVLFIALLLLVLLTLDYFVFKGQLSCRIKELSNRLANRIIDIIDSLMNKLLPKGE